jgi:hypothetical protein
VRLWKPSDGGYSKLGSLISDLTMTTDMICLSGGTANAPRVVTVEYSTTADRTLASGRVQSIDGSQKRVVMQNVLLAFGIGFGPVTPPVAAGSIATTTAPLPNVRVKIGGKDAVVEYAGLAPPYVGLYQFNVIVPSGVAVDGPLEVTVDGVFKLLSRLINFREVGFYEVYFSHLPL